MKKPLLLFLLICNITFSQNTGSQENVWYKINSKGTFVTKIKASGDYAEHEVVVNIINNYWSTAEVQYISEFNYNHKRIKLEWGRVGSGAGTFIAVRLIPLTANYATTFQFQDLSNPSFDYGLVAIDDSLVTPISPKKILFVDEWSGKVGIGTTNPSGKLHVSTGTSGDAVFLLEADTDNNNESDNPIIQFRQDGGIIGANIGFSESFGGNNFGIGIRNTTNGGDKWDTFIINSASNYIGIGTKNPDAKLTVAGNINAREVKVTATAGADFVFENDYKLPTLIDVEQFIKINKHLPEIASAKEMQTHGIYLAEMNTKLLQKIEELTLYTIQQEKKLEKVGQLEEELQNQKIINKNLEEKLNTQDTRLQKIEILLNSKK